MGTMPSKNCLKQRGLSESCDLRFAIVDLRNSGETNFAGITRAISKIVKSKLESLVYSRKRVASVTSSSYMNGGRNDHAGGETMVASARKTRKTSFRFSIARRILVTAVQLP